VIAPCYPSRPPLSVKQFVDDFRNPDLRVDVPSVAFPPYPDIRLAAPAYWSIAQTVDAGDVTGTAHAIVRLCMNRTLRDALARGARRTAEGLDWEVELDRLDASYHEVCARHAGRARFRAGPKPSAAPLTAPGR